MAITNFTPGFTIGTITPSKTDWSKGISLGASNKVSLSNPLGDLNIKPETGQNLLGNINMGQLATMALPMVTGALKSAADKPLQNMTPEQRQQFEAIYGSGDSVLGDLFSMKQNVQNSIDNINSNIHTNTGALGSTQALVDSFNNTNYDAFKQNNDKMSFGQGLSRIADSAAKGFSTGMATGNPFIGLFSAAANAIGSGARMAFAGKNRNTINNAAELALNKTLDNQSLQAENTQKQMGLTNLANANYAALGGQLNYNIDDKYLANDYMSKLNNRVYKPQFDSMNYFAMGGMPDFNEFNTGGTHEQNPNGGIPQGFDNQGALNLVEQGEVKIKTKDGQDYILQDRQELPEEWCKEHKVPIGSTPAEAAKYLRKEYDENPNDHILKRMWEEVDAPDLIEINEIMKQEAALKEARKQGLTSPKMQEIDSQVMQDMYYNENPQEEALLQQGVNSNIQNAFGGNIRRFDWGGFNEENLRYIPAFGDTAAATRNMFAKPDYKYADRLDQMAQSINTNIPTPGNYNYMTYNPVDIQRYLNNYNAQANAARQAIMNTTNPSRNAALLAAQYNDLSGRGELMQAIDQVNKNHYNDVIVRNNAVNAQKNADALNIANANFARQQYQLGLMQQANALRQAEDESLRAARSQQWTNAFNSVGALGQEALANKQANRWFELSKLAPGLTFEQYNNILDGKAELVKQGNGDYKYTEKS